MTAPQVEPLKLTSGTRMVPVSYVRDESGVFHELTIHLPPGTKWVGEERRDDTAELVEAAERHLRALNGVRQRDYSHKLAGTVAEKEAAWDALSHAKREAAEARKSLEAALARVRGEP